MSISQLYHILLKERLVAPILQRHIMDSLLGESRLFKTCSSGHSLEEFKSLRGTIQGLINNNIIQFENATITDSTPTSCESQVNVLIKNKGQGGSFVTGLPTAPYLHGVLYPSLLLNKGNLGSGISQSSGTTVLDLLSVCYPCYCITIKSQVGRIDGIWDPTKTFIRDLQFGKSLWLSWGDGWSLHEHVWATQAEDSRSYQRLLVRAWSACPSTRELYI